MCLTSCGKSSNLSPVAPNSEENLVKVEGVIRLPKGDGTYEEVDASSFLRSSDTPYGTWSGLGVYPANTKVTVSFKPEGDYIVTSLYESSKPETRRTFFSEPITFTVVKDIKFVVTISKLVLQYGNKPWWNRIPLSPRFPGATKDSFGDSFRLGCFSVGVDNKPDGILDVVLGDGVSLEIIVEKNKYIKDIKTNKTSFKVECNLLPSGQTVTFNYTARFVFDNPNIKPIEIPYSIDHKVPVYATPKDPTWED